MGPICAMNFAAFDLNLLRVFNALMRERSATRAGEQVGLSQPAVSAALNRLRDLLDDKLFVRQGNDMVPTPRAESIAPGIQDALEVLESLLIGERTFDPRTLSRQFTLMGADFFATLLIPRLVELFSETSPTLGLRFLDTARGDVERLLNDDAIDMALERPQVMPDFVESEILFDAPFRIVVAANHPEVKGLDDLNVMPLDTFCRMRWGLRSSDGSMRGYVDDALDEIGRRRDVVLAMPHFAPLLACVARSEVAAVVPVQFAEAFAEANALRVFDLPFKAAVPEIRLYWHARRTRDPAHTWLRHNIMRLCDVFRRGTEKQPVG